MQEIKKINTTVDRESAVVQNWQCFGWTLKSSQEIKNIDNHLESDFAGNIYQVSSSEHYVVLIFERNTNMENYQQLSQLEKQYSSYKYRENVYYSGKMKIIISIIIPIFLLITIPLVIVKKRKVKKLNAEIDAHNDEVYKKRNAILAQARSLVK